MNVEARGSRVRVVLLAAVAGTVLFACEAQNPAVAVRSNLVQPGGVPAPPPTLTASSPVSEYLRYGDGLAFAVDSPGSIHITTLVNDTTSVLRVRSAVGLRRTDDTAYITGRIIARWETYRGRSRFGAPVGVSYLWVQRTAPGVYSGTLFSMAYMTGDTSRTLVHQRHFGTPTSAAFVDECEDRSSPVGDTTRVCCACGAAMNCSGSIADAFPEAFSSMRSRVEARRR